MRLPGRLLVLSLVLAGLAGGQDVAPVRTLPPTPTDDEQARAPLVVEQRSERVTYAVGARSSAAPSLGGPMGAAIAGAAGGAWHEDAVVIQSGPHEDARLVVTVEKAGKTTTFDVRADQLVAFVGLDGLKSDAFRPRAIYAEGHVRVVIEAPQGQLLVEAAAAWFDLSRTRAVLHEAEVRGERRPAPNAPRPRPGDLSQATVVLRAERLRALGPDRVVAEGVTVSPCDLGEPHVALTAGGSRPPRSDRSRGRSWGATWTPAHAPPTPPPLPLPAGPPAPSRVKREAPAGWSGDAPLLDALFSRDPAQQGGSGRAPARGAGPALARARGRGHGRRPAGGRRAAPRVPAPAPPRLAHRLARPEAPHRPVLAVRLLHHGRGRPRARSPRAPARRAARGSRPASGWSTTRSAARAASSAWAGAAPSAASGEGPGSCAPSGSTTGPTPTASARRSRPSTATGCAAS